MEFLEPWWRSNQDPADPDPVITGDDRVVVTGKQSFLTVRKMALGPRPEDVFREYIQSIFDLGTGERKGRDNLTNYTAGLRGSGGMASGGDPTPRDQWITTYEANWDPRNFYEAELDGVLLPEDRYVPDDSHLYKLPPGYVAPTSSSSGRTWTEYVWTVGIEYHNGLLQGALNTANGLQDSAIAAINFAQAPGNWFWGDQGLGYLESPDWSYRLVAEIPGTDPAILANLRTAWTLCQPENYTLGSRFVISMATFGSSRSSSSAAEGSVSDVAERGGLNLFKWKYATSTASTGWRKG